MISYQEAKFRSLKDLVDNQIADHFVIDSSALGTHFLTDHNGSKLVPHLAKYNNNAILQCGNQRFLPH